MSAQSSGMYDSVITVKFKDDAPVPAIQQLVTSLHLTELRRTNANFIDYQMLLTDDPLTVAANLEANTIVEAIQLNRFGTSFADPNDDGNFQWHIDKLALRDVWDIETGRSDIVVAVIDSGIDYNHTDIGSGSGANDYNNLYFNPGEDAWNDPNNPSTGNGIDDDGNGLIDDWRGWNFALDTNDVQDVGTHGTSMAGLIAAKTDNGKALTGVAGGFGSPGVRLLPIAWVGDTIEASSSTLAHCIDYAVEQGAKVISMSIGFPHTDVVFGEYPAVNAAIDAATDAGVILVAAAGQPKAGVQGTEIVFPASHPSVISVGGIDQSDNSFGFYGSTIDETDGLHYVLDVVAPAVQIGALRSGNTFDVQTGTSHATAITSGIIALMVSLDDCLEREDIIDILRATSLKINESIPGENSIYSAYPNDPGRSQQYGYGLIQPLAALNLVRQGVWSLPNSSSQVNVVGNYAVPEDIIIPSGTTVTIDGASTLRMAPDRRIIVERGAKLIVDGGTITSGCNNNKKWKGIYVLGNKNLPQPTDPAAPLTANESGVLWVKTGGTIENARNAVYTKHPDQPWVSDYWGGLVVAEVAFFVNNRRAVEFMQYTANNNSRFMNTEFTFTDPEANLAAVTIWDTDNILFDNCTFTGYDTGVIAYDAGCSVLNSTLRDCDFGLEIFATSPVSSGAPMTINNNLFENIFFGRD